MSVWTDIVDRANDAVLDTFGDSENLWTYKTKDGTEFPLNGILERAPELVDLGGNVQQSGDEWTFDYKKADFNPLVTPRQGDELYQAPGERFEVVDVRDDNEGMPRLKLLKKDA